MSTKVIIYGAGPFAELMHYHFTHDSDYEVVAFCLDESFMTSQTLCNIPIIAFEQVENLYPPDCYRMFVAIGYSTMRNRPKLFDKAKKKGYQLVNFISNKAIIRENLILGKTMSSSQVAILSRLLK